MKKRILIPLGIILVGLLIFHFWAANQAETQIDATIQAQVDSLVTPFSVQYSSVDVSPFSGNLEFRDVTIIEQANIERANRVFIDLSYFDFLKIFFSGAEEGLKDITATDISLTKISYVNRESMQEISLASAELEYTGNLWDGIRRVYLREAGNVQHQVNVYGKTLSYSKPNSTFGTFKSDSLSLQLGFPEGSRGLAQAASSAYMHDITWNPPSRVRNQYGFFIQGFGYELNSIPVSNFNMQVTHSGDNSIEISDGKILTELATVNFDGSIVQDSTWSDARFSPLNVSVVELSPQMKNVLSNLENLLGIEVSRQQSGIHFQLVGPISNPALQAEN